MRLYNEDQILSQDYRAMVIKEIEGGENVARKREHLKRYEIYKDRTVKYVIEKLRRDGLREKTLNQMINRASNVSFCKKVVNKLARTYAGGVSRETNDELTTSQIMQLARLLETDAKMKKADRYRELSKNACVLTLPELNESESVGDQKKYNLKTSVLLPWQYDVIEDYGDREKMRVLVLSDFDGSAYTGANSANAAYHESRPGQYGGDGRDQVIADTPHDGASDGEKTYIWWSDSYHFTTNAAGDILPHLSPERYENPISKLPGVKVAEDQDGEFWAMGGDDLIDGSVLINTIITDLLSIAFIQGWGQIVITGSGIPTDLAGGPHHAMVFNYDKENDPEPKVDVMSANPPIDQWLKIVEQYAALLLTTNDLAPSTVAMRLDVSNFPSGVAMLIESSEAVNNIEIKQKDFSDVEREHWDINRRWHNYYYDTNSLASPFQEIGPIDLDAEVAIKYHDIKPMITEKEKLETIKVRKDLGINEFIDLIKLDNPDMNQDEAEEKAARIAEEKANAFHNAMLGAIDGGGDDGDGDDGDGDGEK
jgi:hypothetical protein